MTRRISLVAVCCSCDSTSSRSRVWSCPSAFAKRCSSSRISAPASLDDLRAAGGLASLDFAGFGPRPIRLPLPPMNRPGTGYGEPASQGKGTANRNLSLPGGGVRGERELVNNLGVCVVLLL